MTLNTFIKKKSLCFILSMTLVLSLTGCHPTETKTFEEFTHELFLHDITANTINLHYTIENPKEYGITDYEVTLGDFSKESRDSSKSELEKTKKELENYKLTKLTLEEQLTYDLLSDYLDSQIALCDYELYYEPLSFSGGIQMELPILYAEYEFQNEQDVEDYLELISLTDEYYEELLDFEKEKSAAGLFMSDELCEKVIDSCEAFLENKETHYLVSTFENRLNELGLSKQKTASYIRQNKEILEKEVYPAYDNMILELQSLLGSGTNTEGICHFENGKEYYELLVYSETGCNDTVDEIFERIEYQRAKDLLVCSNLYQKDNRIIDKSTYLEWEFEHPNTALLSLQDAILEHFPAPPDTTYEINYVDPALKEFLAPAFYIVAPVDNYAENTIYINEGYVSSDIYAFTTLAHEGYPGHLYQTVMTYTYDYPDVRALLNYSGYVEGWATYVEMLSYAYADIDEDIASFLSHNQSATLSLYASSDIGLHYYGWTEQEMYDFWAGYGITNKEVIKEITQLILSEPGNYLKYYVGYIEFLELQDYAKQQYKNDYNDLDFHRAVLDIGPAPFHIVEKYLTTFYKN